jgi:hypothetical protein
MVTITGVRLLFVNGDAMDLSVSTERDACIAKLGYDWGVPMTWFLIDTETNGVASATVAIPFSDEVQGSIKIDAAKIASLVVSSPGEDNITTTFASVCTAAA